MNKNSWFVSLALGLLPAVVIAKETQAFSLSLLPSVQNVLVGDIFEVDVAVSGLGDGTAPSLSLFDLNIDFDNSLISFNSATFGDPVLGDQLDLTMSGFTVSEIAPGLGSVRIAEVSGDSDTDLNDLQADSFILATLKLKAIASGNSSLALTVNELGDALGDPITADEVLGANVTVTSRGTVVPESDFNLLSLGLVVGLGCLLRRRGEG